MQLNEITYSESMKLTTDKKFESKLISVSATATLVPLENREVAMQELKQYVKGQLAAEIKK